MIKNPHLWSNIFQHTSRFWLYRG